MRIDRKNFGVETPLTRRRWLAGAAGLLGAAALPGRARANHATGEMTAQATRILVVGDSMIAGAFGLFLARDLHDHHAYAVERRGKSSSGLARPDFFDWIAEAERLVAEAGRPYDATVVMFGGNDVQGLHMGRHDGKIEWIRWQDEGWAEEYARRVNAFADVLAPDGQQIFWIGMPVMRPPKFHARVQRVNTIYRAEMAIRPNATFVDIWSVLADEDGEYADRIYVEPEPPPEPAPSDDGADDEAEAEPAPRRTRRKKVTVRAGDGIHLTVAGAHFLADHVRAVIHDAL